MKLILIIIKIIIPIIIIILIIIRGRNTSYFLSKWEEKGKKSQVPKVVFWATRRRPDYEVKVILSVIGCLKSGKKNFKDDLKTLFKNEKELKQTIGEMKNYTHVNKMGHTSEFLFGKKQLFIKKNC